MTNHIKKMLRIKDEDLDLTCVEEEIYKGKNTLIINGTYSPQPMACKYCHCNVTDTGGNKIVVKNGNKKVNIRLEPYQNMPTILKLKKQRYFCKNCHQYWTSQCSVVEENCFISRFMTFKILELLT